MNEAIGILKIMGGLLLLEGLAIFIIFYGMVKKHVKNRGGTR